MLELVEGGGAGGEGEEAGAAGAGRESAVRVTSVREMCGGRALPFELPSEASLPGRRAAWGYTNALSPGSTFLDAVQKIPLGGDNQRDSTDSTLLPLPTATFGEGRYAGAPLFVHRRQPASDYDAQREGQQCGRGGADDDGQQGDRGGEEDDDQQGSGGGAEEDGYRSLPPREEDAREDDGYVLTFVYDSATHTSELVVLDASGLQTLATVKLPQHVPPLFHGSWVEEVFM